MQRPWRGPGPVLLGQRELGRGERGGPWGSTPPRGGSEATWSIHPRGVTIRGFPRTPLVKNSLISNEQYTLPGAAGGVSEQPRRAIVCSVLLRQIIETSN